MLSLLRKGAALRHVKEHHPDLNVELLYLNETEIREGALELGVASARSALVARLADTVRQNPGDDSALEAAVAIVEVLVFGYDERNERPANGHRHAMQAIQLLAATSQRFDYAVDLFFDLVERYLGSCTSSNWDSFAMRRMQNYDQTLAKLVSKQWTLSGERSNLDLTKPLDRIKALRHAFDSRSDRTTCNVISLFQQRTSSPVFCESFQMLQSLQRRRVIQMVKVRVAEYQLRSREVGRWMRKTHLTYMRFSRTESTDIVMSRQIGGHEETPGSTRGHDAATISRMNAEILDLKAQVKLLCRVVEKSASPSTSRSGYSYLDSPSKTSLDENYASLADGTNVPVKT
ncbi:hypothetical protein LTR37_000417 [Vermiconidia calcicola]|uniref:Uncharacterized protein n=1 Tax=Vermiconidia calcicola TaxID=1690605 RepID=A0ACC3P048_9PEZI|nr:hypothetical protein LTR37_000417 [Vermiconidia calcicola]